MERSEQATLLVTAILFVLILFGFLLGWWSISAVLSLIPYFAIAGIIGVVVWGFRQRFERLLQSKSVTLPKPEEKLRGEVSAGARPEIPNRRLQSDQAQSGVRAGPVCPPGPYMINPYRRRFVALDVRRGERISGTMVESDRQEFNWFIVDQRNLVRANKSGNFDYEKGEDSAKAAAEVSWRAPKDGPWYLLFDHAKRQNPREIHVDLRRT
jgi:hypothetical protein